MERENVLVVEHREITNALNKATVEIMSEMWKTFTNAQKRTTVIEDRLGITEKEINSVKKLKKSWKPYINLLKQAIANEQKFLEEHR